MARRLIVALALAFLLLPVSLRAGDYHSGPTLHCADCHVMHFSQSHPYENGASPPLGAGPYPLLLRQDVNALCLACHDGQSAAPDVFEEHAQAYPRLAGALNEEGGSADYPPAAGHTLYSEDTAPGSNPAWSAPGGLTCAHCHAPHGDGAAGNSYRNLGGYGTVPGPARGVTYSRGDVDGANDLARWAHEDRSLGVLADHYGASAVIWNEPDPARSAYAEICGSCHGTFHGLAGASEVGGDGTPPRRFLRHPNAGVNMGVLEDGLHSQLTAFAGLGNQVPLLSPTGRRPGSYEAEDAGLTPSCMSCHKGHGNRNAFGLLFMRGDGPLTEEGDAGTALGDLCRQCHGTPVPGDPGAAPPSGGGRAHVGDGRSDP